VQTENEPFVINENGWTVRVKPPAQRSDPQQLMLLIHGLGGDENVMWIFTRNLPRHYWLFAPRAPVQNKDGFSWLRTTERWPRLADFAAPSSGLITACKEWAAKTGAPFESIDVMGFSQGAAMTFSLAAFYPQIIGRIICLAGYLPQEDQEPGRYAALKGKKVFIAHGSRDETVPVSMAEEAVHTLQTAGADVTYCPSDAGHKLSVSCLRGLENFIK
jgi:phospholipase/carboxylesterase